MSFLINTIAATTKAILDRIRALRVRSPTAFAATIVHPNVVAARYMGMNIWNCFLSWCWCRLRPPRRPPPPPLSPPPPPSRPPPPPPFPPRPPPPPSSPPPLPCRRPVVEFWETRHVLGFMALMALVRIRNSATQDLIGPPLSCQEMRHD